MEKQQPMTNEEVTAHIRAVFESWWKKYRDKTITEAVLDDACEQGIALVEKYQSKLAFDLFHNLLKQLQYRRVDG